MTREEREEALKVLEMFLYKQCDLARTEFAYDANTVWKAVNMASKALEQEPKGHWIMHIDDLFPAESTMECSECGNHQPLTIDDNYCPNCGAKMEVIE